MKKIHITDIDWDTEDVEGEKPDLPTEWDTEVTEEEYDTGDLDDLLADRLSDEFGFCVNSFCYDPVDDGDSVTEDEMLERIADACECRGQFGSVELNTGSLFLDDGEGGTWFVSVTKCRKGE